MDNNEAPNQDLRQWTVGIVGTGVMGGGIAQLLAGVGIHVVLFDKESARANQAAGQAREQWQKLVAKGRMSAADAERAAACLKTSARLADLAACQLVVEAIIEDLGAKRSLMAALEDVVPSTCILATNTSSLCVTEIQAGLRHPQRFVGWHFFNPVPLMKVAEVIAGELTDAAYVDHVKALTALTGHRAVQATDTPGFIINHAGRGYGTEALRLHGEGVADFATIDRILRQSAGFRMGPFELLDLTGLDVSHPVMESIYHQYYEEPRFRPVFLTKRRMMAGLLGRKSGRGFYDYAPATTNQRESRVSDPLACEGESQVINEAMPTMTWRRPIRVVASEPLMRDRAKAWLSQTPLASYVKDGLVDGGEWVVIAALGEDVTHFAHAHGLNPRYCIGIDVFTEPQVDVALMVNPAVDKDLTTEFLQALRLGDYQPAVINDSPGFIVQRVLAHVVNVACEMAQWGVGSPDDIDAAVRLGLGYPRGPLTWGDELGAGHVVTILENLQRISGDPRYRPSLWLKRRAMLGLSLLQPDAASAIIIKA